jgi:hypothetical protein
MARYVGLEDFLPAGVNQTRSIGHLQMTWGQTLGKALGAKNIPLDTGFGVR